MDDFFARNRLSAYLDGELEAGEAREVEAALKRSGELRAELEALRGAVELLRTAGPVPAPPGFAAKVEARLATERMRRRWFPRIRLDMAMVAAAAAAVLVFAAQKPEAPAPVEAVAPEPVVQPEPAPAAAPPPASADGSLVEPVRKSAQQKEPSRKTQSMAEKEAYTPEWEKADLTGGAAPAVYSATSTRYVLTPLRDTGLKELAGIAAALGGRLTDEKGRPLVPYPMDSGATRTVRIELPAYNAGAVDGRLAEIGVVQVVSMVPDATLYAKEAKTSVTIEVRQP